MRELKFYLPKTQSSKVVTEGCTFSQSDASTWDLAMQTYMFSLSLLFVSTQTSSPLKSISWASLYIFYVLSLAQGYHLALTGTIATNTYPSLSKPDFPNLDQVKPFPWLETLQWKFHCIMIKIKHFLISFRRTFMNIPILILQPLQLCNACLRYTSYFYPINEYTTLFLTLGTL
jgi:hypothetical protein